MVLPRQRLCVWRTSTERLKNIEVGSFFLNSHQTISQNARKVSSQDGTCRPACSQPLAVLGNTGNVTIIVGLPILLPFCNYASGKIKD